MQPKIIKFLKKETSLKKKKSTSSGAEPGEEASRSARRLCFPVGSHCLRYAFQAFAKSDLTLSSSRCNKSNSDVDIREGF